jgi:hypothetical protein
VGRERQKAGRDDAPRRGRGSVNLGDARQRSTDELHGTVYEGCYARAEELLHLCSTRTCFREVWGEKGRDVVLERQAGVDSDSLSSRGMAWCGFLRYARA